MTQPSIDGTGHGIPRMIYGSDGSKWYAVLVDSDGHVKIDVVTSGLPTDAATATNQATMITALQLIDDLRAALGSVATDYLRVSRVGGGINVDRGQGDTLVKTGAAKIWWITIGSWGTVATNILIYNNTSAAGTVIWAGRILGGTSLHAVFDPPIEPSIGIYIDVGDATTEFIIGYS